MYVKMYHEYINEYFIQVYPVQLQNLNDNKFGSMGFIPLEFTLYPSYNTASRSSSQP